MAARKSGDALYLSKAGTASWVFCFMFSGRSHEIGLGPIRDVGLAQAREPSRCVTAAAATPSECPAWRVSLHPTSSCENDYSMEPLGASRPFCSMAWPGHSEYSRITSEENREGLPSGIASTTHDDARRQGAASDTKARGIQGVPPFSSAALASEI